MSNHWRPRPNRAPPDGGPPAAGPRSRNFSPLALTENRGNPWRALRKSTERGENQWLCRSIRPVRRAGDDGGDGGFSGPEVWLRSSAGSAPRTVALKAVVRKNWRRVFM